MLQSLGLPVDMPVLHEAHPVVVAFKANFPEMSFVANFVLAPAKTKQKCSLFVGDDPIFQQFLAMHCMSFCCSNANARLS